MKYDILIKAFGTNGVVSALQLEPNFISTYFTRTTIYYVTPESSGMLLYTVIAYFSLTRP